MNSVPPEAVDRDTTRGASVWSTLNLRRRLAVELRLKGRSLVDAAQQAGLSMPTVVAAFKAWQQGGWDAVDTRPRGRKPAAEQRLTPEERSQLLSVWGGIGSGLWSLKRACAHGALTYTKLSTLARTQLEPMAQRLLQAEGLMPPDPWAAWRRLDQGELAQWLASELPPLRRLAREMDTQILALSERTLPGHCGAQLAAHTARGTVHWWRTAGWPTDEEWLAFLKALRQETGSALWLLCQNPFLPRQPRLAAWLSEPTHGVKLIALPAA